MSNIAKMYLIETGRIIVPDSDPLSANNTEDFKYTIPVPAILLEHKTQGLVLLDTGIEPEHFSPQARHRLVYDESKRIDKQLALLGYKCDDVKTIVLSHWHRDHHNQLFLFPHAAVYMRRRELEGLMAEPARGYGGDEAAAFERFRAECPEAELRLIDDVAEYDVFGDGSLLTIDSKGHTPGHQSFLIKLAQSGAWLFSADAVHNHFHADDPAQIQNTWDRREHIDSILRLKAYAEKGVKLIYGHDTDQWAELKLLPEYYA